MEKHAAYLSLGSNLGDRRANLLSAIRLIDERVGRVARQSSFIETEPWGYESDNLFLNAVILCETALTPRQLLRATQNIERQLGRHKNVNSTPVLSPELAKNLSKRKYTDRPIDIDILLYDDLTVDEPDLKIPHPLMRERNFVMIPLQEIMK